MAEFNLPNITSDMTLEQIITTVGKMKKTLEWLLYHMDSKNITEINTNRTTVKSEDGETYIDGPVVKMTDGSILRLTMGYDASQDEFNFILYDENGVPSLYLNDNGEAVFSGNIETSKDIYVGNKIYLGDLDNIGNKGIYFATGNEESSIVLNTSGVLDIENWNDINIFSNETIEIEAMENMNILGDTVNIECWNGGAIILSEEAYIGSVDYDNYIATYGDIESIAGDMVYEAISQHIQQYHQGGE